MNGPRIILAGGGDAPDSAPIDRVFADWSRGGRTLYLPVAMDGAGQSYESCLEWFRSVFGPLGLHDVEMWTDLEPHRHEFLSRFQSIYLGGGNTFRLLKLVRESGFHFGLADFALRGGAIYGGSAGAILLGKDISTCAHMDVNEVGLTDMRGLDLANGHSNWCHYTVADEPGIEAYRQSHAEPLWAIPERAGIVIEGGRARAIGGDDVIAFEGNRREVLMSMR
jgi:dipeptidase E